MRMLKLPAAVIVVTLCLFHDASGRVVKRATVSCPAAPAARAAGCWDLGVSLEVSSVVTTPVPRQLELSWFNARPEEGDTVALYDINPNSGSFTPLITVDVTSESGFNLSGIQAPSILSEDLGFTPQCLGYWVAYTRLDVVLASDCLRTLPTWMKESQAEIGEMLLMNMFLPGTHNSGSYKKYSATWREDIITKYTYTQEEDVLAQMIYGIRYLDIRIAYYSVLADPWWTFHGRPTHPLRNVLQQFKTFIDNTDEIVILDIQEFNGFGDDMEIHDMLVALLTEELGEYLVPSSLTWEATLNEIWGSERRLIVTYDDSRVSSGSDILWRSVQHRWGNVQTLDDLYKYLAGAMISPPNDRAQAMMAELTATALGTITDELGGLRKMADTVNRNVTLWFRGAWGETVNVVAADFFRGTAIIEESVAWNLRRASNTPCGPPPPRH